MYLTAYSIARQNSRGTAETGAARMPTATQSSPPESVRAKRCNRARSPELFIENCSLIIVKVYKSIEGHFLRLESEPIDLATAFFAKADRVIAVSA